MSYIMNKVKNKNYIDVDLNEAFRLYVSQSNVVLISVYIS